MSRLLSAALILTFAIALTAHAEPQLTVGFGVADITPPLDPARPIWLAGKENGRAAKAIHDSLFARAVVLGDGGRKIATRFGRFDRPATPRGAQRSRSARRLRPRARR